MRSMLSMAFASLVTLALSSGTVASAQDVEWEVSEDPLRPVNLPFQRLKYGPDHFQAIRYNRPRSGAKPPLVVFVGDEQWRRTVSWYPMHFLRSALYEDGYAFAAVDTIRNGPVPARTITGQLASALSFLRAKAGELGFDADRIVLLGNGSGGQIVTLMGTNPSLLKDPRNFAAVRGVVSVNGEAFDVPRAIRSVSKIRANEYRRVFSEDERTQIELSPARNLALPNASAFLFQAVSDQRELQLQSYAMHDALKNAGAKAAYAPLKPWRRDVSSTYYGTPGNPGYLQLRQFLSVVARVSSSGH